MEAWTMSAALTVVIPCLNEEREIGATLGALAPARARGVEVIVADGGSADATLSIAGPAVDRIVNAPRGRASQMNAGALAASGDVLLFLHADTRMPRDFDNVVLQGLESGGREWGRFDVHIDGRHRLLALVAAMMNVRSRITGIATGDQALFVRRAVFREIGGFASIPLMEDIALTRALRRRGPPLCLRERVITSGRRWDEHGLMNTVLLMWRLRYAYWRGVDPRELARRYVR
jgi:rSAM/selenodomain-associated transferase 2